MGRCRPRAGLRGRHPAPGPLTRSSAGSPLVVAHRGASGAWPEHTPAAYAEAIAAGADAVECDVRLSADGHLVCVHDARLERTSNGTGPMSRLTLADLRALDWGSWHPSAGGTGGVGAGGAGVDRRGGAPVDPLGGAPVDRRGGAPADPRGLLTLPELCDLLLAAPRPVGLLVETKHPVRHGGAVEAAVAEVLAPVAARLPLVAVMSFWPLGLRRIARLAPGLPRVQLRADRSPLPDWGYSKVAGLAMATVRRDPGAVRRARRRGLGVYVWTVDAADDVDRCVTAGVDAIITNRPREVRAMLSP